MKLTTSQCFSVGVATSLLVLILTINSSAADYYTEPPESVPHAKLAYIAERTHTFVLTIDGKAVLGNKKGQRLMTVEGAVSNEYMRVTPGHHSLRLRIFYPVSGDNREVSDVSAVDAQFQAGHTYYPLAEKTPLGNGKVRAVFSIVDVESLPDLEPLPAEHLNQTGEGDAALSVK